MIFDDNAFKHSTAVIPAQAGFHVDLNFSI